MELRTYFVGIPENFCLGAGFCSRRAEESNRSIPALMSHQKIDMEKR
jgi:hypothetical protein